MPKHYLRIPARKLVNCEQSESIDNALRRFKRKVQTEDIIKEVKPYSFYLKPDAKHRVNQALLGAKACSNEDSQGVVSGPRTDIAHDRQTEIPCYGAIRPWI
jgi:small subunit ribosomal protein S21